MTWTPVLASCGLDSWLDQVTDAGGSPFAFKVTVAAGARTASVVFSKAFPLSDYTVLGQATWNTTWWVSAFSTTGFTVNFNTPAPTGGGTFRGTLTA